MGGGRSSRWGLGNTWVEGKELPNGLGKEGGE